MGGLREPYSTKTSASAARSRIVQATVSTSLAEGRLEMPGLRREGEP
jgi:hypothetical protein